MPEPVAVILKLLELPPHTVELTGWLVITGNVFTVNNAGLEVVDPQSAVAIQRY